MDNRNKYKKQFEPGVPNLFLPLPGLVPDRRHQNDIHILFAERTVEKHLIQHAHKHPLFISNRTLRRIETQSRVYPDAGFNNVKRRLDFSGTAQFSAGVQFQALLFQHCVALPDHRMRGNFRERTLVSVLRNVKEQDGLFVRLRAKRLGIIIPQQQKHLKKQLLPVIIKYPFWNMTSKNPDATYACVNYGEAVCPKQIKSRSICIDGDIGKVMGELY